MKETSFEPAERDRSLHVVAASGDVDALRRALESGANVDARNRRGATLLMVAVAAGGQPGDGAPFAGEWRRRRGA